MFCAALVQGLTRFPLADLFRRAPDVQGFWWTDSEKIDFLFIVVVLLGLDPQSRQRENETAGDQKFHGSLDLCTNNRLDSKENLYQVLLFQRHLVADPSICSG